MRVYLAESGGVFRAYLSKEGLAKMSINGTRVAAGYKKN